MSGRAVWIGVVLLAGAGAWGATGCAHRFGRAAGPELRFSANPDVRWETDGPSDIAVILENAGSGRVTMPWPSPAHASVQVFERGGAAPICRKEAEPLAGAGQPVDLAPRERRALVVRLDACDLAPGEYRYEAWYVYLLPEVEGTPERRLGPEHGRIVVQRAAGVVDVPASRKAVAPPPHGEAPGLAVPANPHLEPGAPPLGPASFACADRELARRGLNAWGDPAGRVYPAGPPTLSSEVERQKMIFERYPDIATLCRISP